MTTHSERAHHDTTVVKIDSTRSPRGAHGEKYLASGVRVSMRLWANEAVGEAPPTERDYETVGYVIAGSAELHVEGQRVRLEPGDSYVVPRGARHHYRILEPFTAVEATSPPAHVHGRDERPRAEREQLSRSHEASDVPARVMTPDDAREVLLEIQRRADLPAGASPGDALSAVMCALCDRIIGDEMMEDIALDLPESVRPLVERCGIHRGAPAAVFSREGLEERVAAHLDTDPATTAVITRAVFAALEHVLPEKDAQQVMARLPSDLVELWHSQ